MILLGVDMILLDVDPNVVEPGSASLLIDPGHCRLVPEHAETVSQDPHAGG